MKIAWACSILAVALVATAPSHAQPALPAPAAPLLLGPFGGFDFALESARIPVYASSADCGEFTSGTAGVAGAGVLLSLPSFFDTRLGLSVAAGVARSRGTFVAVPAEPTTVADRGTIISLEREYRLDHDLLRFSADLLATLQPAERLEIAAGASLGYQTSASFTQTDNITGPDDYAFPDGKTTRLMVDGTVLSRASVQAGPRIRIAYRLPLGPRLWLQPAVTAYADLLSPVREAQWRSFSVGGGAAVLFDLSPRAAAPPPEDPLPPAPLLAASIELYGVDEEDLPQSVAVIKVDEELYRQNTPLLPVVYFGRNTAEMPERYEELTRSGADTFRLAHLSGTGMLEMQHRALDVIGWRLRADTSGRITLIGSTSHDEPGALGRGRAEAVRSYLEEIWGIERERMMIGGSGGGGQLQRSSEITEDGRADNRRVEIMANTPGITAPIVTEQVVRNFNPPMIRILPSFEAEAGVQSWSVTISQESSIIARYSSEGEGNTEELTWNIIHDRIDSALAPLVAELVVEDSLGASVVARTEIPLHLEKRLKVVEGQVQREENREQIAYTLAAFNYNSAELTPQHSALLREIAREIRDSARISITGYTDRVGDERSNAELSTQRAESAAKLLRTLLQGLGVREARIRTSGAGMETERFTNDLPEGRALSRGVTVMIEQDPVMEESAP